LIRSKGKRKKYGRPEGEGENSGESGRKSKGVR